MSLSIKSSSVTIQMKATEQYFPVVLFILLYKVVLTFESVGKTKNDILIPTSLIFTKFKPIDFEIEQTKTKITFTRNI